MRRFPRSWGWGRAPGWNDLIVQTLIRRLPLDLGLGLGLVGVGAGAPAEAVVDDVMVVECVCLVFTHIKSGRLEKVLLKGKLGSCYQEKG